MFTSTIVEGVTKMGNIVPRVRIESSYLALQASWLTITPPMLPDVTTLTHGYLSMWLLV